MNRSISHALFERAKKVMPGGVNSPVRAFKSVGMNPPFIARGYGSHIWDVDGNEYIDYVNSWGPLILGHAHPAVVDAIKRQLELGTSYGAATEIEVKMAELVCELVSSVEIIRMVNSGTEATMSAIRLARGYTGRNKIVKFAGCYHGHSDSLLIRAGSGATTFGVPDSKGVPGDMAKDTLICKYNDVAMLKDIFEKYGSEIAGVIVEPVAGNMGTVLPHMDFLRALRDLTGKYGALLIFDEVMTGFRVSLNCAQGLYGIKPDLTTFGKIIGGGLPVGAYGGREEIMRYISPDGPVYQAGTLSGNPLAMAAGYATLTLLKDNPEIYHELANKAEYLKKNFCEIAKENDIDIKINNVGSMMTVFFNDVDVVDYETALKSRTDMYAAYFKEMLEQGIYMPPSQFETFFISTEHSYEDLDKTIEAFKLAMETLRRYI
ncbi:glutamate-1-semialdehyde 2,1-aminomutase [Caldanaerobius fijiensis DSM 17918]|uniref:Glutamate-1-semialdehyde 2,1-aminomutase n=1 Tax=Caldanaerobius fijiensis DSM 17918 TaxID=1121256 RepID=A0A1M4YLM4_9THEO|nr:glutamate-1-semialdehyde 2,1-aminomutase [Caldanaerobius fijiensis]SHF06432.1 glutamate-1-semialdehyde 2,1-aminomutase [Caldanaerobius fijiensis DSM 17918]